MKINIARTLSMFTIVAVLASMLFSESPLAYLVTVVFVFVLTMLVFDLFSSNPSGYPWSTLFFYFSFVAYIFVYSAFLFLFSDSFTPRNLLSSLYFPSLLVLSFLLFRKDINVINMFSFCFLVFFLFASYKVVEARSLSLNDLGRAIQTNWTNLVGSSLIFAFLLKRKLFVFTFLLVGTVIVFIGLKRSGILVVSFYWLIYLFSFNNARQFLSNNAVALAVGGLGMLVAYNQFGANDVLEVWNAAWSRVEGVTEDGGSGRDTILMAGWSFWISSGGLSIFFGQGHAAFQKLVGLAGSLHNDFAELVVSYGLIGFAFLITVYCKLIYFAISLHLKGSETFPFSMAVLFAFTVYSNVAGLYFYPIFFCPLIVGYGYLEAKVSWQKSKIGSIP